MAVKSGRQADPIGLDLSGQGVRAVQVETLGAVPHLVDMVDDGRPVASDEELRDRIDALVRDRGFVGRRIATSISSDALSIHHVRLPAMSDSALPEAISSEVAERIDYAVGDAVIRHLEIASAGGRDGHADYIVFTVPRGVVEQHLRMAEKLGLVVAGISALPLALGHAFSYLGQRREECDFTFLLAHLEPRVTHLMILHRGELRFARTVPQGAHDILDAVAGETGQDPAALRADQELRMKRCADHVLLNSRMTEVPAAPSQGAPLPYEQAGRALEGYAEEILSCLCYFASTVNSRGVDKVLFVGPQANDYDFCQTVANRLGLLAQIGDPLAGIRLPSSDEGRGSGGGRRPRPEMAVAVGLTLFGAVAN